MKRASWSGAALKLAVSAVAATALVNWALALDAESRNKPRGSFIAVDGVRLHYVERGAGKPVILLHGNGASWEDFAASGVLDRLAARHRVIAFDRPGFGHTRRPRGRRWTAAEQAELIMKAARMLGAEQPVLVGHSWGALVALAAGLDYQEELAGLVLLAGYLTPTLRADVLLLSIPALPVLGDLVNYTIAPILGRRYGREALRKIFGPNEVPARFRKGFPAELALRPSQLRASARDYAVLNASALATLEPRRDLKLPVFIIAGTEDQLVDADLHSRRLHQDIPGSRLELVEGAGHMVHHVAPDAVVRAVEEIEGRA